MNFKRPVFFKMPVDCRTFYDNDNYGITKHYTQVCDKSPGGGGGQWNNTKAVKTLEVRVLVVAPLGKSLMLVASESKGASHALRSMQYLSRFLLPDTPPPPFFLAADGCLPKEQVVAVLLSVVRTLKAASIAGVHHGDVTPHHIVLHDGKHRFQSPSLCHL
jgi:hypothetical protein